MCVSPQCAWCEGCERECCRAILLFWVVCCCSYYGCCYGSISCSPAHLSAAVYPRLAVVTVPPLQWSHGGGQALRRPPPQQPRRASASGCAPGVLSAQRHCWLTHAAWPLRSVCVGAFDRCRPSPPPPVCPSMKLSLLGTCAPVSPRRSYCRQSMQLHAHAISCCNHATLLSSHLLQPRIKQLFHHELLPVAASPPDCASSAHCAWRAAQSGS